MSTWNWRRYMRGWQDADDTIRTRGIEAAHAAYDAIPAPDDVNEYEVGFITRINTFEENRAC